MIIFVDAAADLPAEPAGADVLIEQRTRAIFLAERPVQILQDAEARIQPHQVDQLERPHRVIEPELERPVDIACARDAFLQHVKRLVADHGVDAAGHEAW